VPIFKNLTFEEVAYTENVSKLADSGSDELISNGNEGHAQILVHQMLLRATDNMRILSTFLRPDIYNDSRIISAMEKIISKGNVEIRILLQDSQKLSKKNEFLKLCYGYNKCKIYQVANPRSEELKAHFITMDNKAYRYCADSTKDHYEDDAIQAVASFNRPQTADNLNKRFERFSEDATEVVVPWLQ